MTFKSSRVNFFVCQVKACFLSLLVCFAVQGYSQSGDNVYQLVDEMPVWTGCHGEDKTVSDVQRCSQLAIIDHVRKGMVITDAEKLSGLSGTIYVSFIVGSDGLVREPNVEKGLSGGVDNSVREAVLAMPRFSPGMMNGAAVSVRLAIPIKVTKE